MSSFAELIGLVPFGSTMITGSIWSVALFVGFVRREDERKWNEAAKRVLG